MILVAVRLVTFTASTGISESTDKVRINSNRMIEDRDRSLVPLDIILLMSFGATECLQA